MNTRNGILAIGNLLIDRTLVIPAYPQEAMLTTIDSLARHCGGGCTNVLFNLARLAPALPRYLAGAVGEDDDGRFIIAQAQAHGIDCRAVIKRAQPTSFTDVMISRKNGSRTFFHHLGAMADYGSADLARLHSTAKIAHIAYLPLLPALLPDLLPALEQLRAKGLRISADLVSVDDKELFAKHILPALAAIDYLIINDIEAAALLNAPPAPQDAHILLEQAQALLAHGVRECVIIHSAHHATACARNGQSATLPAVRVAASDIISTLGAGDAFCSGALYALHENLPLPQVLAHAHAMAHFNLFSLSATDGAASLAHIHTFIGEHYP